MATAERFIISKEGRAFGVWDTLAKWWAHGALWGSRWEMDMLAAELNAGEAQPVTPTNRQPAQPLAHDLSDIEARTFHAEPLAEPEPQRETLRQLRARHAQELATALTAEHPTEQVGHALPEVNCSLIAQRTAMLLRQQGKLRERTTNG